MWLSFRLHGDGQKGHTVYGWNLKEKVNLKMIKTSKKHKKEGFWSESLESQENLKMPIKGVNLSNLKRAFCIFFKRFLCFEDSPTLAKYIFLTISLLSFTY